MSLPGTLRLAIRSLAGTPGLTGTVIFTLAIGLGATLAIAAIVDAVLLARLPLPDPDRLVVVWEVNRERPDGSHGEGRNVASPSNFVLARARHLTRGDDVPGRRPRHAVDPGELDRDR